MAESVTSENFRTVFTYPFKDPKWLEKLLIGSLLFITSFLILPIFLIYGYFAEIMRSTIEGKELILPEWDQWERKFTDGAKLFVIGFIYALPFIVLSIGLYALMFASVLGSEIPSNTSDPYSAVWVIPSLLGTFGAMFLFGFVFILGIIAGALMPVLIAHVIATDDFSAAFRIGEWWSIFRANLSGFLITYLLVLGLFTVFYFVSQILYMTIILCCILPFIAIAGSFYIMVVASALFGQAYREGVQNLPA